MVAAEKVVPLKQVPSRTCRVYPQLVFTCLSHLEHWDFVHGCGVEVDEIIEHFATEALRELPDTPLPARTGPAPPWPPPARR